MSRWLVIAIAVGGVALAAVLWRVFGPQWAPLAAGGGVLAWLGAAVFGRKRRTSPAEAQERLDMAVELGQRTIDDADAAAAAEVEHGLAEHDSLSGYLNDRTGND